MNVLGEEGCRILNYDGELLLKNKFYLKQVFTIQDGIEESFFIRYWKTKKK